MKLLALLCVAALAGCAAPGSVPTKDGGGSLPMGGLVDAAAGNATVAPSGKTDPAMESKGDKVEASTDRQDIQWGSSSGGIYVKADAKGFHFNLNQAAKAADALMDEWALVFAPDAPYRKSDTLFFCGPAPSVGVTVYAKGQDSILFQGPIDGVPVC